MKQNALKSIEIEGNPNSESWQRLEAEIAKDSQLDAEEYVKSAKVDLGGE